MLQQLLALLVLGALLAAPLSVVYFLFFHERVGRWQNVIEITPHIEAIYPRKLRHLLPPEELKQLILGEVAAVEKIFGIALQGLLFLRVTANEEWTHGKPARAPPGTHPPGGATGSERTMTVTLACCGPIDDLTTLPRVTRTQNAPKDPQAGIRWLPLQMQMPTRDDLLAMFAKNICGPPA